MNDGSGGWFKMYRSSLDHWTYEDAEAFKFWYTLILKAQFVPTKKVVKGKLVILAPGQVIYGRRKWSNDLNISESKLERIVRLLEEDGSIWTHRTNKCTIITLNNYKKYQSKEPLLSVPKNEENNQPQNIPQNQPQKTAPQSEKQGNNPPQNTPRNEQQTNHKPTEYKKVKKDKNDINYNCPYKDIVDLYHKYCISLSKIRNISDKRKKIIRKSYVAFDSDINNFKELFIKSEASDFLTGRKRDANNKFANWNCTFDFIIDESKMTEILEGKYDNRATVTKQEIPENNNTNNETAMMETAHSAWNIAIEASKHSGRGRDIEKHKYYENQLSSRARIAVSDFGGYGKISSSDITTTFAINAFRKCYNNVTDERIAILERKLRDE